jgi:hypothetical protein
MCSNHQMVCRCGQIRANLFFRNHILPPESVSNLYCPLCSARVAFDEERMIADNDWILEYDMDLARASLWSVQVRTERLSPAFLFDEGYATWNGFTPTELEEKLVEREKIVALASVDMRHYLAEIKRWGCERVQRLREVGWRKAQGASP